MPHLLALLRICCRLGQVFRRSKSHGMVQAFRALQGLIMSVLLTAVDGKHSNPMWPGMGYPGQPRSHFTCCICLHKRLLLHRSH